MSERRTCTQCGDDFVNISKHWTSNPSCEWPDLTDRHRQLVTGLLLVKGNINRSSRTPGSNPALRVESTNEPLLDWLEDEFEPFSCDVKQVNTAEEVRNQMVERGWDGGAEYSATYRWKSRSHPQIAEFERNWYETVPEDERTRDNHSRRRAIPPHEVSRTPTTMLAWYLASSGGLVPKGDDKAHVRLAITSVHVQGGDKEAFFRDFLEPFNPRISHEESGGHPCTRIVLRDSAAFFDYIGDPPSGYGFEDKWPESLLHRDVLSVSDRGVACPVCGRSYIHLSSHWQGQECRHPELSSRQKDTLRGLVYGGATVNVTGSSKRSHVLVDSTNEAFLDWVSDELKWLTASIRERKSGGVDAPLEHWDSDIETTEYDTVYRLQTRSHAFIEDEFAWLVDRRRAQLRGDDVPDAPRPAPGDVANHATPHVLRTMYAYRGRPPADASGDDRPTLACTYARISDEDIRQLFGSYEPELRASTSSRKMELLFLQDGDKFYESIGTPPTDDLADMWPAEHGGTAKPPADESVDEDDCATTESQSDPLYDVF